MLGAEIVLVVGSARPVRGDRKGPIGGSMTDELHGLVPFGLLPRFQGAALPLLHESLAEPLGLAHVVEDDFIMTKVQRATAAADAELRLQKPLTHLFLLEDFFLSSFFWCSGGKKQELSEEYLLLKDTTALASERTKEGS